MLAVTTQYGAWHELFRGIGMSANLEKEGLSDSTRHLAEKHAGQAAIAIVRSFPPGAQSQVRSTLESWIEAHLDLASKPFQENASALRGTTDRLARILILNAPEGNEILLGPGMSSQTRVEILEQRLHEAIDRFIELLAAKIEKKGIRKAQQESKIAAESVARFVAEWLV